MSRKRSKYKAKILAGIKDYVGSNGQRGIITGMTGIGAWQMMVHACNIRGIQEELVFGSDLSPGEQLLMATLVRNKSHVFPLRRLTILGDNGRNTWLYLGDDARLGTQYGNRTREDLMDLLVKEREFKRTVIV